MLRMIPNWQDRHIGCYFCHTTISVKYLVKISGMEVYCCNRCAATHSDKFDKGELK